MVENLTYSTFAELADTRFFVHYGAASPLEVLLVEAVDVSNPWQDRFSVVFRGPHEPLLQQRIYRFEHEKLGPFDLFIVPIKRDSDGLHYEAVFNHFRKKEP
jgi:hypothetical protein